MFHYYLREVNLNDAKLILHLLGDDVPISNLSSKHKKNSISAMRDYIRQLKSSAVFKGFVWERESQKDEALETSEFAEAFSADKQVLAFVFTSQTLIRNGTVQIEFLVNSAVPMEAHVAKQFIEEVLRNMGQDKTVKIVHFHIPRTYRLIKEQLELVSARTEHESYVYNTRGDGEDAWMDVYTLNKLNAWPFTWDFVVSPMGLIAIYGNEDQVFTLEWFDYGEKLEDISIRDLCIMLSYAHNEGVLEDYETCLEQSIKNESREVPRALRDAASELRLYLAGKLKYFTVPFAKKHGTSFQKAVWAEIDNIPYGSTRSYEEIGTRIAQGDKERGRTLTRVVGQACGANPLPIFTPCHRVIAKNGKLQGYAFGVEKKDYLLRIEILGE